MIEREYPRWVHGDGHVSVVAETPDAEAEILERWAEADAIEADHIPEGSNALTVPRRRGRPPKLHAVS